VETGLTNPYLAQQLPDVLPDNPMHWAAAWLDEATRQSVQRNPNSMTLVTVATDGRPSARVVLCKDLVPDPGYLVFYTNYKSRKVQELRVNPQVAITFHWDALGRQIRVEGTAVLSPAANVSDDMQSIESIDHPVIPRPAHWGGVRVWASSIELWIEGGDRIHDRGHWQRRLELRGEHDFTAAPWQGTRLQP
jgi:pyridoxamine 5'-phosphate oxidase